MPRPLIDAGYDTPSAQAHYPQGLLSCLYRLQSRLPVDFDLCPHNNERTAALAHLKALQASDVIVYDRGYYSFELLCAHRQHSLHAVFRMRRNSGTAIDRFIASDQADTIVSILPGPEALRDLSRKQPGSSWQPVPLRLVKYTHGGTEYILGTTLLDRRRYRVADLSDLYHARWGIEELYKVSKQLLEVDQFHGRSERLVKQELFAHFNLIAMTRLFTNRDADVRQAGRPRWRRTWKACCCAIPHLSARLSSASARGSGPVGASHAPTARTRGARCSQPRNGRGAKPLPPSQVDADTDEHALSAARNRQTDCSNARRP